jgi:hypothetical protein
VISALSIRLCLFHIIHITVCVYIHVYIYIYILVVLSTYSTRVVARRHCLTIIREGPGPIPNFIWISSVWYTEYEYNIRSFITRFINEHWPFENGSLAAGAQCTETGLSVT